MASLMGSVIDVRFGEPDEHGNLIERGAIVREGTQVQGNCRIGAYSRINGATIYRSTIIGRYCSIARNAAVGAPDHPMSCLGTSLALSGTAGARVAHPTHLGNDVWVGANAVIRAGLRIGDGAAVGAGAVVTHDIEPYAIVVGVPARLSSWRFPEEIRDQLLQLQWWNLDHETISQLPHANVEECIRLLLVLRNAPH